MTSQSPKRGRDTPAKTTAQYSRKRRQTLDLTTLEKPVTAFPADMSLGVPHDIGNTVPSPTFSTYTDPGTHGMTQDAFNMMPWDGSSNSSSPPFEMPLAMANYAPQDWFSQQPMMPQATQPTTMNAPAGLDPDLQMEFEMNTDMGMVLRPSSEEAAQPTHFMPYAPIDAPMNNNSPSQWLDPPASNTYNEASSMANPRPPPKDGLGCAGQPTTNRDQGLDKALEDLGRLDSSLKADARKQINMVNDERRAGLV